MKILGATTALLFATGCYFPIPLCDDQTVTLSANGIERTIDGAPNPDGTFMAKGKIYVSCTDFCASLDDVRSVVSCEPPKDIGPVIPGSTTRAFGVTCTVEIVRCEQVGGKDLVSFH